MPTRDRAAYMRGYRKKAKPFLEPAMREAIRTAMSPEALMEAWKRTGEKDDRIVELEAEVARLKRELDLTHTLVGPLTTTREILIGDKELRNTPGAAFNSRPFTPAPKPSQKGK